MTVAAKAIPLPLPAAGKPLSGPPQALQVHCEKFAALDTHSAHGTSVEPPCRVKQSANSRVGQQQIYTWHEKDIVIARVRGKPLYSFHFDTNHAQYHEMEKFSLIYNNLNTASKGEATQELLKTTKLEGGRVLRETLDEKKGKYEEIIEDGKPKTYVQMAVRGTLVLLGKRTKKEDHTFKGTPNRRSHK